MQKIEGFAICSCALLLFVLIIWGMTGNCPLSPDGDEWFYVIPALRMAQTCTFNPLWLSHPASTIIYPLLFYFHFLNAVNFHGALFTQNVTAENVMFDNLFLVCYLPRFMSAFTLIACIPVIYGIAKAVFGKAAAICSIFMFAITPQLVALAQVVRSDCPALFFSLLAIYAILKLSQTSFFKFQIIAATAIGLAMSSRYSAASLLPLLLAANVKLILRAKGPQEASKAKALCVAGLVIAFLTFAATTPYLFLDFGTFKHNMTDERGDLSLGRDGYSPFGNVHFYLTAGIPYLLDQYLAVLALVGLLIAWFGRNRFESLLLASYPLIVIAGTSLHPCHEQRYMLPTLPIFVLFAANAIAHAASALSLYLERFVSRKRSLAVTIAVTIISVGALKARAFQAIGMQNTQNIYFATRALWYDWLGKNIPAGTPICLVGGLACPHPERYKIKYVLGYPSFFEVANHGKYLSPDEIAREGFEYFLVDDAWNWAYFNEPLRYANHCRFYNELWANSTIVKQFAPQRLAVGTPFETQQKGALITLYKYHLKQ
jgi:hypothetical protein